MADTSTSLGQAIGLQGVPKDYALQFEALSQRKDALEAKKAAAKQKADEDEDKRVAKQFDIKPNLYLPNRHPEMQEKLDALYQKLHDNRDKGVSSAQDPATLQQAKELEDYFKQANGEYQRYIGEYEQYKKDPKSYNFDPEIEKTYGGINGNLKGKPFFMGGLQFNGDTNAHFADVGKDIGKNIDVKEFFTSNGQQQNEIIQVLDGKNKSAAEFAFAAGVEGTDKYAQRDLERIAKLLASGSSFQYQSPEEQKQQIHDAFISEKVSQFENVQDLKRSTTVTGKNITNINIGGGEKGAESKQLGQDEFTIEVEKEGGAKELLTIPTEKPDYVISFKKGEYIVPVSQKIIDLKTLEPVSNAGNIEITGGYTASVPVYKKGTIGKDKEGKDKDVGGLPVDKNILNLAKKENAVEYKFKFIGNGVDDDGLQHQIMYDVNKSASTAATLKEAAKDQPKVVSGIEEGHRTTKKLNEELKKPKAKRVTKKTASSYGL